MATRTSSADPLTRFNREYQQFHALSEGRIHAQTRALEEFADHAGKPLLECGADEFGDWLADMVAAGLQPSTVQKKAHMVKPFYSFAFQKELIDGDHLLRIRSVALPRVGRTVPRPYTGKELKAWRTALNDRYPFMPDFRLGYWWQKRSSYKRVADHAQRVQIEAIISLALYGGLRRAEMYAVTIDEMHPDNAYIVVKNGKGGKGREVPHTKQTRERIGTWLDFREKLEPPHDDPWLSLYPCQPEGGWLKSMRWPRFEGLLHPIKGDWTYHRFRHTAATNWLRAGMKLEVVQRLLGHASIQQTLGYAELVRTDVQKAVEKYEDTFEQQINAEDA